MRGNWTGIEKIFTGGRECANLWRGVRLISLGGWFLSPLEPLPPSELLLEWETHNANNPFQSVMIDNYHF